MTEKLKPNKEPRVCPYCDEEIAEVTWPYCDACQVEVFYCPKCRKPIPPDSRTCPHCGVNIRKEAAKGG